VVAPIEFWFEFASTYSYPAAMRIEALCAAAAVPLCWRPFLLGPIFAAQGWRDSPFNLYPAKGRNMWRDLERICAVHGLPFRRPTVFPRNGLLAARVACAGGESAWVPGFVRAVYVANFAEDRDIADAQVIGEILARLGREPAPLLAAGQSPAVKAQLREQTDLAMRRGIFGAPTCTVADELFWGNDRLEQAVAWQAGHAAADRAAIGELLDFWFGSPGQDEAVRAQLRGRWFSGDAEFDARCRMRFAALVGQALRGELDAWQQTPHGRLALILALDQLTRNIYRGTATAFAGDPRAQVIALAGIDAGADRSLDLIERAFFYMPLAHAEDAAMHVRAAAAFERLVAEAPPDLRTFAEAALVSLREDQQVIARFGRFPHRNEALGRESTPAERAYLAGGGARFGQ
jgi:uncharacterized protein (DUF924 family)/2-hydroxychromene-2-carboxylate isomerase